MDEPTEDLTTYRWVAAPGSAKDAARSLLRMTRTNVLTLVILWIVTSYLWSTTFDAVASRWGRLLWGFVVITGVGLIVLGPLVLLGRAKVRRQINQRIRPGDEMTSRFGPRTLALTSPLSRHEYAYADIGSVRRVGDWVLMTQVGSTVAFVWPAALFPDLELERIRAAIEDRASA